MTTTIQFKKSTTTPAGPALLSFAEPAVYSSGAGNASFWVGDSTNAPIKIYPPTIPTYTATNGVQLIANNFSAKADTASAGKLPIAISATGISVPYDIATLQVVSNNLTLKNGTAAANLVPLDITNGTNIPIDNVTIMKNVSNQLYVASSPAPTTINGGTF